MRGNFSSAHPAWVSIVVLTELAWILTRRYRYLRPDVGAFLHQLLHTASICVEDHAIAGKAIDFFLGSTADFSDCLILARNESRSISPTHTLDRKAAKLAGFQLL